MALSVPHASVPSIEDVGSGCVNEMGLLEHGLNGNSVFCAMRGDEISINRHSASWWITLHPSFDLTRSF
jgi:hypothetical protein